MKFNEALRRVIDYLVSDLITIPGLWCASLAREPSGTSAGHRTRLARFSDSARDHNAKLKAFLFNHVYNHPQITEDSTRSVACLAELFAFYMESFGFHARIP